MDIKMNKKANQKAVKSIRNMYFPFALFLSILLIGLIYAVLLAASYWIIPLLF